MVKDSTTGKIYGNVKTHKRCNPTRVIEIQPQKAFKFL